MSVIDAPATNASETRPYLKHTLDADSHEMIPSNLWTDYFGPAAQEIADRKFERFANSADNSVFRPDVTGDNEAITPESVWTIKGPGAPSAIDLSRRCEAMDVMGIDRQLVFPSFGLVGTTLLFNPLAHEFLGYDPALVDRIKLGKAVLVEHNEWAAKITALGAGRLRPVGIIFADTLGELMQQTEDALASGIRAVWLPSALPPANTSPADRKLDPYWKLLADNDIPLAMHLGTEFAFTASPLWSSNVPEFEPSSSSLLEFPVEPLRAAGMNFCIENFLGAMILGGVLERHENLRVGAIEVGAQWVGSFADRLDMWAEQFSTRFDNTLTMRPSAYLDRNVRVTPFHFEAVDTYFERYPHLSHVYCYSSDFPHREGGKYSKQVFLDKFASTDEVFVEQFFASNADRILPAT